MISCTEFIPLYSELFKFLEKMRDLYEKQEASAEELKACIGGNGEGNRSRMFRNPGPEV